MPVSKEAIICPYCQAKNFKSRALGISGLINYSGMSVSIECDKCFKDFKCEVDVAIKFKTKK